MRTIESIFGVALIVVTASAPTPAPRPEARYGLPRPIVMEQAGFVVCFDGRTRQPAWTVHYLDGMRCGGTINRAETFAVDKSIPREFRPALADYESSGFDRGHLVPAADCQWSHEAMSESFRLSNISPQYPEVNRGIWAQLEKHVRSLVERNIWRKAIIVDAPLWRPEAGQSAVTVRFIGKSRIPVPTHFAKAVLWEEDGAGIDATAWIVPNRAKNLPTNLDDCRVSVDTFEHWSGLDVFALLPAEIERELEGRKP